MHTNLKPMYFIVTVSDDKTTWIPLSFKGFSEQLNTGECRVFKSYQFTKVISTNHSDLIIPQVKMFQPSCSNDTVH